MNHNNRSESAATSLKLIVDSLDAIVDKSRRPERPVAAVADFLQQLTFPEVKALYFIAQAGRTPSWLQETHSIEPLFVNLSGIRPVIFGKQGCIDFILSMTDDLQTYIARYVGICNELEIDPFKDLGLLVQDEIAQCN